MTSISSEHGDDRGVNTQGHPRTDCECSTARDACHARYELTFCPASREMTLLEPEHGLVT